MRVFALFFAFASALDEMMMMLMMQQQQPNQQQNSQLNTLFPLLMLRDSNGTAFENQQLLMMMLMQNGGQPIQTDSLLPLLMLNDDNADFSTLFLALNMFQQDCSSRTDSAIQNLMPMLLMDDADPNKNLMMMLMFQTMGDNPLNMDQIMPYILLPSFLNSTDTADDSNQGILMMILLSSMTGGLNEPQGFANSFNMLLPLILADNSTNADDDSLLILMLTMQSQSPETAIGSNMMLPLLLMSDDSSNEVLMFYMMTQGTKPVCEPEPVEPTIVYVDREIQTPPTTPAPVVVQRPRYIERPVYIQRPEQTIYRTFQLNPDGTRTLVDTEEGPIKGGRPVVGLREDWEDNIQIDD